MQSAKSAEGLRVRVKDLIDKGILTLEDFRVGKAGLSAEAFNKYMQQIGVMPK